MESVQPSVVAKNKIMEILLNTYLIGEQSEDLDVVDAVEIIKKQLIGVINFSQIDE